MFATEDQIASAHLINESDEVGFKQPKEPTCSWNAIWNEEFLA